MTKTCSQGKTFAKWMCEVIPRNFRDRARRSISSRQGASQTPTDSARPGQRFAAPRRSSRWRILAQMASLAMLSCTSGLKRERPTHMAPMPPTVLVTPLVCDGRDSGIFVAVHELPYTTALLWIPGLGVRMSTVFSQIFDDISTHIQSWDSIPATSITQGEAYYIQR